MDLTAEERPSDSPFVERVWTSHSEQAGSFVSIAEAHCGFVVTKYQGKTILTIRGPETRVTPAFCPPDAEFIGVQFKTGVFMPDFPAPMVMNRQDVDLPEASSKTFWLKGGSWQFPNYENMDTFLARLARDCLLEFDPVVNAVLNGFPLDMSLRTVQRRFLQATGLTHGTMHQIKRARYATILLKQGVSILDTVNQAGYADQPHLTRALKRYVGQTPAQLVNDAQREPLSLLFKTLPF